MSFLSQWQPNVDHVRNNIAYFKKNCDIVLYGIQTKVKEMYGLTT